MLFAQLLALAAVVSAAPATDVPPSPVPAPVFVPGHEASPVERSSTDGVAALIGGAAEQSLQSGSHRLEQRGEGDDADFDAWARAVFQGPKDGN